MDDQAPESEENDEPGRIHPSACIDAGAVIEEGVRVWHHAHVREGARLGAGCTIGKNVYIDRGVVVGARSKIQNNVSVYAGVHLEQEVFVGPSAVFTNDRFPRAVNPSWRVVETAVRRGATVGANATVVCGIDIGEWAMVAAGAVVTHDVAAQELVGGNPARRLGWVCRCGEVLLHTDGACPRLVCGTCDRVFEGSAG